VKKNIPEVTEQGLHSVSYFKMYYFQRVVRILMRMTRQYRKNSQALQEAKNSSWGKAFPTDYGNPGKPEVLNVDK
jgi:hypothetical protein